MTILNEIIHNPLYIVLLLVSWALACWTFFTIFPNPIFSFSVPSNKKDQVFSVEEVIESNSGKCFPCANEYNTYYLLHIKVVWRNFSKTIIDTEWKEDGSNDGTSSDQHIHFRTKEKAEEKALELSNLALGLVIEDSKTILVIP